MNSQASTATPATPAWLQYLDHTADAGIIVQATTLAELFARAAWAMFSVLIDMAAIQPRLSTRVSVAAADRPALLVRWLAELNFLHVTRHEVYCRFDIQSLSETQLVAEVHGEKVDLSRHLVYTEIKAVTFHALQIEPTSSGWKAQVIFDL
jgi:SHS2 domain-containing protein